ncbi:MAG: T9SS type A sorting domain-containing protein [bacterium]|nr:T9SS type A sorting domain-containing protein [bacterium]
MQSSPYRLTFWFLLLTMSTGAAAQDKQEYYEQKSHAITAALAKPGVEIYDPPLNWPLYWGLQRTSELETSFDCFGVIGGIRASRPYYTPYWRSASFESPPGSGIEYMYSGGIFIGGIIGDSTHVSTVLQVFRGYDAEFRPTGNILPGKIETVTKFNYISDFAMRAELADTFIVSSPLIIRHRPMGLQISLRNHVWRTDGTAGTVIYDMVLTNIGHEYIEDCVVSLYIEPDICYDCNLNFGFSDDLAGGIQELGIGYAIDNNGDPFGDPYDPFYNPIRAIAGKFLSSSFAPIDTSFNWWTGSGGYNYTFGPYQVDSAGNPLDCMIRDSIYGTIDLTEENLYCLLSDRSWDPDQAWTYKPPPGWAIPSDANLIATGRDIRFLLSLGKFDLAPDSSIRVQFATFIGRGVHVSPDNSLNLPVHPELFTDNLNFDDLILNAAISDSLGQLLLDPTLPPIGLHTVNLSEDSAHLEWDPWVYPEVTGYELYVTEIPDSVTPYPQVPPPWYSPSEFSDTISLGRVRKQTLFGLDPFKMYAVCLAHRLASGISQLSDPIYIPPQKSLPPPKIESEYLFVQDNEPVIIEWEAPDSVDTDYYNIYKFNNQTASNERFEPFYDDGFWMDSLMAVDSFLYGNTYYYYHMPVYLTVDSGTTSTLDYYAADGNVFVITAVDKSGQETSFSTEVSVNKIDERTKDILVITSSNSWYNTLVSTDSIELFYRNLLFGYDYDIYSLHDSLIIDQQWRMDWHDLTRYKSVIIDDQIRSEALDASFEDSTRGVTRFLASGGRLAYFGSLATFTDNGLHSPPGFRPLTGPLFENFIGVDSVYSVGLAYYLDSTTAPFMDTLFGFQRAESVNGYIPNLTFEYPEGFFTPFLHSLWPQASAPTVATFAPRTNATVTHLFRSHSPTSSRIEGNPVGVLTEYGGAVAYLFGFHLWYMNQVNARHLIDYIMLLPTDVAESAENSLPTSIELHQNYPNPFNPETNIRFSLPVKAEISLELFNILGRKVRTLADHQSFAPGSHSIRWDGLTRSGQPAASGLYFYRLNVAEKSYSRKMILLR